MEASMPSTSGCKDLEQPDKKRIVKRQAEGASQTSNHNSLSDSLGNNLIFTDELGNYH